mmetsp:Transcript_23143/g.41409  ORF Transcript_23143/g.41409 Transcript_23143/m.41409 type:complete len:341 (-) Transcript_23143:118-1140(-)
MAPIDLQSRDLGWISDFVMQQMVIMIRPMMDHLQQTDTAADYTQRAVQRLSMDVTECRSDIERTNKYLAILRQGLGVQNEGKCMLQRGLEGNTRTIKRLDEQMESMLGVMRGVEDSFSQLCSDFRGSSSRQEELQNKFLENSAAFDSLQAKVERMSTDAHAVKDDLLNSEARLEVWQRELRELRRAQLSMVPPKLEEKTSSRAPPSAQSVRATSDSWPEKKGFSTIEVSEKAGGKTPGAYASASNFGECSGAAPGSSQQSKRISRVGNSSSRAQLLPQVWTPGESENMEDFGLAGEEVPKNSQLPLLAARQPGGRTCDRSDRSATEGPRLRFTATRGSPN